MIRRRHLTILAGAASVPGMAPAQGSAQGAAQGTPQGSWTPGRAVTVVVPYPAGGPSDILARLVAQEMARDLGSPVVVENVPGGGAAIGTARVARGPADGTLIAFGSNQTHATNVSLLPDGGGYHPQRDFAPILGLVDLQHVLVVRNEVPARSVAEFLDLLRARPGAITCASTGQGSAAHLTYELFQAKTGLRMVHVPYRGSAPLMNDLMGGHVDVSFATTPTILSQVQSGRLRALAVASPNKSPFLPDLPTMAEAGVQGVEADAWFALFSPAATPAAAVSRLREVAAAAMTRDPVREAATRAGMTLNVRPADALARFLDEDIRRWQEVIRTANVRAE